MVRQADYLQSVIGDCGHDCDAWPQITSLGSPTQVICNTCTREKYGIPDSETISVWVDIREPAKKEKPKRKLSPNTDTEPMF
jgi:hypothetical protein